MTAAGDCKDFQDGEPRDIGKEGVKNMCWSPTRYEVGNNDNNMCEDPDDCLCIQTGAPNGLTNSAKNELGLAEPLHVKNGKAKLISRENIHNIQVDYATHMKQSRTKCMVCEQHNFDPQGCNECKNCKVEADGACKAEEEHKVNMVKMVTSKTGRAWMPGKEDGNMMKDGKQTTPKPQDLTLLPHFPIWSISDKEDSSLDLAPPETSEKTGTLTTSELEPQGLSRFPYESRREPLNQRQWTDMYTQNAPNLQLLMDELAKAAKTQWSPNADEMPCNSPVGNSFDIAGKIEKLLETQYGCHRMQTVANSIAGTSVFESKVFSEGGKLVNCVKNEEGMCSSLNCYTNDTALTQAIDHLRARNDFCRETARRLHSSSTFKAGDEVSELQAILGMKKAEEAAQPQLQSVEALLPCTVAAEKLFAGFIPGTCRGTDERPRPLRARRSADVDLNAFLCSVG